MHHGRRPGDRPRGAVTAPGAAQADLADVAPDAALPEVPPQVQRGRRRVRRGAHLPDLDAQARRRQLGTHRCEQLGRGRGVVGERSRSAIVACRPRRRERLRGLLRSVAPEQPAPGHAQHDDQGGQKGEQPRHEHTGSMPRGTDTSREASSRRGRDLQESHLPATRLREGGLPASRAAARHRGESGRARCSIRTAPSRSCRPVGSRSARTALRATWLKPLTYRLATRPMAARRAVTAAVPAVPSPCPRQAGCTQTPWICPTPLRQRADLGLEDHLVAFEAGEGAAGVDQLRDPCPVTDPSVTGAWVDADLLGEHRDGRGQVPVELARSGLAARADPD